MYIERNVFQLKFGVGRQAIELWKEYLNRVHKEDDQIHVRLLTDVSGKGYSLILEQSFNTFEEAEPSKCRLVNREDWKEFYVKFIPLCESSERTYYKQQVNF
ncbi:MAG TPA: hypothetical protein VFW11_05370 [Cyclobacteriaceae bacterium]|nr:hypothetical protein [Cyclobacteriaceae bacterium]